MMNGPGLSEIWIIDPRTDFDAIAATSTRLGIVAAPPPARITSEAEAGRRATAYLALRLMIAVHDGIKRATQLFASGANGKPELPGSGVTFSLSHCDGLILVAVAHGTPVGVDVLAAGPMRLSVARRDVLERGARTLASGRPIDLANDDDRLRQAWARIEAVAKASGLGIGGLLELIGARPGRAEPILPPDLPVAADLELPAGFFGAVACHPDALRIGPRLVAGLPSRIATLRRNELYPAPPCGTATAPQRSSEKRR